MTGIIVASAYKQLSAAQKVVVDTFVASAEREAERNNERISAALYRPIDADQVEASNGILDNAIVRAAIVERINEIAAASELTVQRVVKEYMSVAFATVDDFMHIDEWGQAVIDLAKAKPETLRAIKSIETEETGDPFTRGKRKTKLILHDKLSALGKLAEFMGMLEADNPHWRAESARPVQAALPAGASADVAADLYGRMING